LNASVELLHVLKHESHSDVVLPRVIRERGIDLMVMGAFGHSPLLRDLLVGSTTTQMIRAGQTSMLLFR
jgi:nucleotide-binding universal stress UspA family protein